MGIRSLKTDKAPKKARKGFLKGLLAFLVVILLFLTMVFIRYGKEKFLAAPEINMEDFLSGAYELTPEGGFVVPFNQRMKEETIQSSLEIHPQLKTEWVWEGKKLILKPLKKLQTGDEFLITVDTSAKNILGQSLRRSYELNYEVGYSPQIRAIYPVGEILDANTHVAILFSHPMLSKEELDEGSLQQLVSLTPSPQGEWKWYNQKTLVFEPASTWDPSTRVKLSKMGTLSTYDGAVINDPLERSFQTERISAHLALEENKALSISSPFILSFNHAPDKASVNEQVKVLDERGRQLDLSISFSEDNLSLNILPTTQSWEYGENYTVQISESLMPQGGNLSMGESFETTFQTESFFLNSESSEGAWYNTENEELVFAIRDDLPEEELKKRISLSPDFKWEMKKLGDAYKLSFDSYSHKRENIKLMYSVPSLENNQVLTLKHEQLYKPAPVLSYITEEQDQELCVYSNNEISESSRLLNNDKNERGLARITIDEDQEKCASEEFAFVSYFEKKFFSPQKSHELELRLIDNYENSIFEDIQITTQGILTDQRRLERESSLLYQQYHLPEDLQFSYLTENIDEVIITLCKLEAKLALEIETSYEERWFSFEPTPEKCLKFERVREEFSASWGKTKTHQVSVSDMIDGADTGLYYFHILAPGYYSAQGDPIETNAVLQYSNWSLLSKRGKSSLLWLYDHQQAKPVEKAQIRLISNDGILLQSVQTDVQGIYSSQKNRLKYEFLHAKKGTEELLLSVFSQEGLEPARYDVPYNISDEKYRHQFYLEEPTQNDEYFKGVFILKSSDIDGLSSPGVSQGVVALYDLEENLLWRKYRDFDEYGTLQINIPQRLMIQGGQYQLEVCLGLHQGLCQGESFWTFFKSTQEQQDFSQQKTSSNSHREGSLIFLPNQESLAVGGTLTINIDGLEADRHALLTVERDGVYWHEILIPTGETLRSSVSITEDMVPEVIVSVLQISENTILSDMKSISIERNEKSLQFKKMPTGLESPVYTDHQGKIKNDLSSIVFSLYGSGRGLEDKALEAFYPRLGTSIISAANVPYTLLDITAMRPQIISNERYSSTVFIRGVLQGPDEEAFSGKKYYLAHDNTGLFANLIAGETEQSQYLEVVSDFPRFVRPADKIVYRAELSNTGEQTKNLQIINSSPDMSFTNGSSIFIGLPYQEKRVLGIAAELQENLLRERTSITMSIIENDEPLYSSTVALPIARMRGPSPQKTVIHSQSNSLQSKITLPIKTEDEWTISMIIAPSPVVFVLDHLKELLKRKTVDRKDMVLKMALAVDFEELIQQFDKKSDEIDLENELLYIKDLQMPDGGWSYYASSLESDEMLSAHIAKSLSVIRNSGREIDEGVEKSVKDYLKNVLDERVNERVRSEETLEQVSEEEQYREMYILHGLSSLTPSGVSYANMWYNKKEELNNASLVLLLLIFEDYRDAGVSGTLFKIEELIQLLKQQRTSTGEKLWLRNSLDEAMELNDFILSSWYLESLVRQASSRTDIPELINWLIEQKNLAKFQSILSQAAYLQSMGSYLKIYQEQIIAPEVTVQSLTGQVSYEITQDNRGQAFFLQESVQVTGEEDYEIVLSAEQAQPLFVEIILEQKTQQLFPSEKGLAISHHFKSKEVREGDLIDGEIILFSDAEQQRVVLIQPQIAGTRAVIDEEEHEGWVTLSSSAEEKWILISDLPEGETRIPFQWEASFSGVYPVPPVYAYVSSSPEIYGTSAPELIEIR